MMMNPEARPPAWAPTDPGRGPGASRSSAGRRTRRRGRGREDGIGDGQPARGRGRGGGGRGRGGRGRGAGFRGPDAGPTETMDPNPLYHGPPPALMSQPPPSGPPSARARRGPPPPTPYPPVPELEARPAPRSTRPRPHRRGQPRGRGGGRGGGWGSGWGGGRDSRNSEADTADLNLRELLIQQLTRGSLECMICFEMIRPSHATWDCQPVRVGRGMGDLSSSSQTGCSRVFHIHCIRKWCQTAQTEDGGWRCPFCQGVSYAKPSAYLCFCRKVRDPVWDRREIPHSCGEVCGKSLDQVTGQRDCPHACTELCHPGPCPPCQANVRRSCPCGKTSQTARCGLKISCNDTCGRLLNCSSHRCSLPCHDGECPDCDEVVNQECHCSKAQRSLPCTKETVHSVRYACEATCDKPLSCGNHTCQAQCHPGSCQACQTTPALISRCPCGQTNLDKIYERDGVAPRKSCVDPIPTCGLVCQKQLDCGHSCEANCHNGKCPTCPLVTDVRCRCGFMDKEMACAQLTTRRDDARCDKRCNKKRDCGRHKCNQPCCIDIDHRCPLICGKLLGCATHRCADPCHKNNCFSCPNVSFDELHCHCGAEVIYPPIQCGTKPPVCNRICSRNHECSHAVLHSCHSDPTCPPCVTLTNKWCFGKHEMRKNVMCYLEGISCGRPCGSPQECGRHLCDRVCHQGDCTTSGQTCVQPCLEKRETCGHPCNAPCHEGPCPNTGCKEMIKVSCECGHRFATRICSDQTSDYKRMQMAALMSQMGGLQSSCSSVDLSLLTGKANKMRTLECNEACSQLERNKRLALALQLENPERESKLSAPRYSEFLKNFAKKDPAMAQHVHERLSELVKLAKESKHKSRSHSFECMNREKRQFVHEYCEHFGVTSESFDAEPKRNVVATAVRDQIWIPSQSLLDVALKQRRAPGPVMVGPSASAKGTLPSLEQRNSPIKPAPVIDYFGDD